MKRTEIRCGRFCINAKFIDEEPSLVKAVMSDMIVVRAEYDFITNSIEYIAISDHFDVVKEGYEIPRYYVEITNLYNKDEIVGRNISFVKES